MKNLLFLSIAALFLATSCTDTPETPADPNGCDCYEALKTGKDSSPIFDLCTSKMKSDPTFKLEYDKCYYAELTGTPIDEIVMPEKQEKLELTFPEDASYNVVTDQSTVRWTGKKITGDSHSGTVDIKTGSIGIAGGKLANIDFVIDMTTIQDITVEDPEDRANLEGHLKSPDFFGTENFPEASFSMTRAELSDFKGSIYGDLTIKGQTHEVKADVVVSQSGATDLVASGTMFFDRTKFDVKYGSGTIFSDLGDKAIRDNVPLTFSIKGVKAN